MEFVSRILEVLGEIQLEMAMVPVSVAGLVHLSGIAFRTSAGSVALQTETAVIDEGLLSGLVVKHVAADVGGSVGIGIVGIEQGIPLVRRHRDVYFRDTVSVKDIGQALLGRVAAVVAAAPVSPGDAAGIVAAAAVPTVIFAAVPSAVPSVVPSAAGFSAAGRSAVQRVLVTGWQDGKGKQRRKV